MAVLGGAGRRFVGWGPVLSVRDPTDTKFSDLKKSKKMLIILFSVAVSKNVFSSKTERFFLLFRPLVHPTEAVRTEKTEPFSGLKWATNAEKVDFPGLGGRSG